MVYGDKVNTQLNANATGAAFKVKRLIGFYAKDSDQYAILWNWLTLTKRNGYAPNGNDIIAATGYSKDHVESLMAGIQRNLIRIGLKPLRVNFFC